ncbi:MAG: hypothetical protein ACKVPX_03965 [Myxococcaceae bacterium]
MPLAQPSHLVAAKAQLEQAFASVGQADVNLLSSPWADVEKAVIRVLGGPFRPESPEHQVVAIGLATALAERLSALGQAFWFVNRDSPDGLMMGFSDALIMLSPVSAVLDALSRAALGDLEKVGQGIRQALAQAKFAPSASGVTPKLSPDDYQRLFDAGFVQLVVVDAAKAATAWDAKPVRVMADIREALSRLGSDVPQDVRTQMESQLVGALSRLGPDQTVIQQAAKSPRLVELLTHLFGSADATGAAPEEFWAELAFPLLFVGKPSQFPPLSDEEREAVRRGADPSAVLADLVPYQFQVPEEAFLGAFDVGLIEALHPELARVPNLRLVAVDTKSIQEALSTFSKETAQDTLRRFREYLEKEAGAKLPTTPETKALEEGALVLLSDLKRLVTSLKAGQRVCVRRLTEGEATSEVALARLRQRLQGPRIILSV